MEIITAEQAAEAAKGLTFEKVWAALMESRQREEKSQEELKMRMDESQKRTEASQEELKRRMEESRERTDKILDDLSKNIGGLGNSLGRLTEALFAAELWKKFNELGYLFSKQGSNVKFTENKKVLAEIDLLLENGEYAMLVEVKTDLSNKNIDRHLRRIEVVRRYFDARGDKRILIGAAAGGIVPDDVLDYAQEQGLYVVTQTGDSVAIAGIPQGFQAREW